jgi:isoamylase
VNFALFSEHATGVELCLFDAHDPGVETERVPLREHTAQVWHTYVAGLLPGQIYGYRVYGPEAPASGHRFQPQLVLLDPYARGIVPPAAVSPAAVSPAAVSPAAVSPAAGSPAAVSSAGVLGWIVNPAFDWGDDQRPHTLWRDTVVYEAHVRGFTRRHPGIPEPLRGTYAGLASAPAIEHLRHLGVTAVELLPVHYHADEPCLLQRGLSNYWGYSTLGFFAPDPRYAASGPFGAVDEFKAMVRALHAAGIEVILDVVYNHTGEGPPDGPTLSFRGIDNAAYYRLAADRSQYIDYTGCGNSLDVGHPRVLQLIMDSLRYWAEEMHVDGFRFDLASALTRQSHQVDQLGAFLHIIQQEPVLSRLKLIAEPWDLGPGGYQVGNFPALWTEWNDKYRGSIRRFWKGDGGTAAELATRLAGSSDLYQWAARRPQSSLNFVTAHDGFTLRDLVSYDRKHNESNGEQNRDGTDANDSWNCGAEGPTSDPAINELRARQQRNLLVTLLLSQGVPMLVAGDEMGRTQLGNNNAYCQDSPLTWLDWALSPEQRDLLALVRSVIQLRQSEPVFRRRRFLSGRPVNGVEIKDLYWSRPDGQEMSEADWRHDHVRALAMYLPGDQIHELDDSGEPIVGNTFAVLLNAHHEAVSFRLGARARPLRWACVLDTAVPGAPLPARFFEHRGTFPLQGRSLAVLRAEPSQSSP